MRNEGLIFGTLPRIILINLINLLVDLNDLILTPKYRFLRLHATQHVRQLWEGERKAQLQTAREGERERVVVDEQL